MDMNGRNHVVLLGDSIFDNASYVPQGQAVIDHLRRLLPPDATATLVARDGDVVADVADQLRDFPQGATHLAISAGGNDALGAVPMMNLPAQTVNDALRHLPAVRLEFKARYRDMLQRVLSLGRPVAVCTVYEDVPWLTEELKTALALFNDTITREALNAGLAVIDLRHLCTDSADYSAQSPIEPSGAGARKIAFAIGEWIAG